MAVLIPDPLPESIQAFLLERRRSGADRFDELWEGVVHLAPATTGAHDDLLQQVMRQLDPLARARGWVPAVGGFNLGGPDDYRIPDAGVRRERSGATYFKTAALVVEVRSPNDETDAKLSFYAKHRVDEVLIIDPVERSIRWLGLDAGEYRDRRASRWFDIGPATLAREIDWPPLD